MGLKNIWRDAYFLSLRKRPRGSPLKQQAEGSQGVTRRPRHGRLPCYTASLGRDTPPGNPAVRWAAWTGLPVPPQPHMRNDDAGST